jgi:hypothetical protein
MDLMAEPCGLGTGAAPGPGCRQPAPAQRLAASDTLRVEETTGRSVDPDGRGLASPPAASGAGTGSKAGARSLDGP